MLKVTIDDVAYDVPEGITVLQACQIAQIEVPVFCYHSRLSIAGNCRMCLVEISGSPKLAASCAMPLSEGMVIHTKSEKVQKARKGVLEFLLINHPLDCPICDQGGQCDLQDITMAYGPNTSRYQENKRAILDKDLGPLIETHMNRCIHCMRCVRFATEIAGVPELGAIHRGEETEIINSVQGTLASELSGNLVDLCPVGALSSKPYAFHARPWELTHTESIDVHDAMGSHIRVDTRGGQVLRVLPRLCETINEEWISDKTRYACDGLQVQRLDRPYIKKGGKLTEASWEEALATVADLLRSYPPEEIGVLFGDLADAESMMVLNELMKSLGVPNRDGRGREHLIPVPRASYLFNTTFQGIDQADACLFVGSDPRLDAAVLTARFRARWRKGAFPVGVVGPDLSQRIGGLTFPFDHLGESPSVLEALLEGKGEWAKTLASAQNPMLVFGPGVSTRDDGWAVSQLCLDIAQKYGMIRPDWNGFNYLSTAASRTAALDLGCIPSRGGLKTGQILEGAQTGRVKVLVLLHMDVEELSKLEDHHVVYIGSHGDYGAHAASVILPACAYTEKEATYVNGEGRLQQTLQAAMRPGEAREDVRIILDLAIAMGMDLGYHTAQEVALHMYRQYPNMHRRLTWEESHQMLSGLSFPRDLSLQSGVPFRTTIKNFYMTDPICRASKTMALCAEAFHRPHQPKPNPQV